MLAQGSAAAATPRTLRRSLLRHLVEDRLLSPRGDDGLGHPVDPDKRPAAAAALLPDDRFESVDPVGAHVLAESEEHHMGHCRIVAARGVAG